MKLLTNTCLLSLLLACLHTTPYTEAPTKELPKSSPITFMYTVAKKQVISLMGYLKSFLCRDKTIYNEITYPVVDFNDVIGLDDAKRYMTELIGFIKNPTLYYTQTGTTPHRGVLLHGPPGVGKTFLVEALPGELKKSFAETNKNVRAYWFEACEIRDLSVQELLNYMRNQAPCIIHIHGIDTLLSTGQDKFLEEISTLMHGQLSMDQDKQVIIIAETDRIEKLNALFPKPNQFGKQIELTMPTYEQRLEFLEKRLSKICAHMPLFDLEKTALETDGWVYYQLNMAIDQMIEKSRNYAILMNQDLLDEMVDFHEKLLDADNA